MSKKKSARTGKKVNKSAAIRDFLSKNPDAKPKRVVEILADRSVAVSAAFVSQVKLKMKQGNPLSRSKRTKQTGNSAGQFSEADLLEAKRLVDKIGLEKAREAIELLAKLAN